MPDFILEREVYGGGGILPDLFVPLDYLELPHLLTHLEKGYQQVRPRGSATDHVETHMPLKMTSSATWPSVTKKSPHSSPTS